MFEVTYEKRYERLDLEEIERIANEQYPNKPTMQEAKEFYNKVINGKRIYVPIPDRANKAKRFVATAIEITSAYEIDVKISKSEFGYEVNLTLEIGTYSGLKPLIECADEMSFFPQKSGQIIVSLDYYTHRIYTAEGSLIAPSCL